MPFSWQLSIGPELIWLCYLLNQGAFNKAILAPAYGFQTVFTTKVLLYELESKLGDLYGTQYLRQQMINQEGLSQKAIEELEKVLGKQ